MAISSADASNDVYHGMAAFEAGLVVKPHEYKARQFLPNQIELKVTHCGICGSDLHTLKSEWGPTRYPQVVGHEIVGIVTKIGDNVDKNRFKLGMRVGVGAQCQSCHECKDCNAQHENLCDRLAWTYASKVQDGYITQGGYADYYRCDAAFAFPVPENIPSHLAAPLFCAGITVYQPLRKHGAGPGKRVGVIGVGGLGHLAIKFAAALGAEVTALSSSERKKDDALNALGAHHYVNVSDPAQRKKAARSLDLIICTAFGTDTDWNSLLTLVDSNGTFVMVGLPPKPMPIAAFSLTSKQISLTGSAIGSPAEIEEMLQLSATKNVVPIVQVVSMSKATEALQTVEKGDVRYRIVLEN